MSLYLEKNMSSRQIALLLDMNPSSISRRIRKITKRLTKGIFILCSERFEEFTRDEISIAKDYFLKGLSIRKIADKKNTSFHQVRQTIKEIQHTTTKN